jgi:hypothetical protein
MIDLVAKSSSEPMNVSVQEHLESLISFVVVTPNPEGRGFSVEVHGDLAVLVSSKRSFKKDFHKSRRGKGTEVDLTVPDATHARANCRRLCQKFAVG